MDIQYLFDYGEIHGKELNFNLLINTLNFSKYKLS